MPICGFGLRCDFRETITMPGLAPGDSAIVPAKTGDAAFPRPCGGARVPVPARHRAREGRDPAAEMTTGVAARDRLPGATPRAVR